MADDVRIYCEVCGKHQLMEPIKMDIDNLNPGPWADIVCAECHFVVATVIGLVKGTYRIVRVGD